MDDILIVQMFKTLHELAARKGIFFKEISHNKTAWTDRELIGINEVKITCLICNQIISNKDIIYYDPVLLQHGILHLKEHKLMAFL